MIAVALISLMTEDSQHFVGFFVSHTKLWPSCHATSLVTNIYVELKGIKPSYDFYSRTILL